jgi:hypothetical protein
MGFVPIPKSCGLDGVSKSVRIRAKSPTHVSRLCQQANLLIYAHCLNQYLLGSYFPVRLMFFV